MRLDEYLFGIWLGSVFYEAVVKWVRVVCVDVLVFSGGSDDDVIPML